jgi:hypothetical protein
MGGEMSGSDTAFVMRREVVDQPAQRRVVVVDTIAHLAPEDADQVIATGSHGGISSGEYAARFFNDAGGGKEDAGIAALPWLDARGTPAGAVSHDSAVIGDALETWQCGVVSALNARARALGFVEGEPLQQALRRVFGQAAR